MRDCASKRLVPVPPWNTKRGLGRKTVRMERENEKESEREEGGKCLEARKRAERGRGESLPMWRKPTAKKTQQGEREREEELSIHIRPVLYSILQTAR